ncbi:hypothetical protein [Swaminathania salitolerans]|uniref:Auto-transporter adhesin head GIN domain-containing protein n=1 Tax=Swaminathania salitolerans TaxID=182838 RepID=A0A511BS64_9PROT|nr:hypothetical protein [Swaminathania salitolerans]GBQ11363.1 hypothetical protein AA21291_0784 [Swaminathania salitolerans LMG 21291]GEL02444.1 hypothetical protein SSA02_16070 [Swaminathania salitolerans]
MIRLSLILTLGLGIPAALASPGTPQAQLEAAPYTLRIDTACSGGIEIEGVESQEEGATLSRAVAGLSFISTAHEATLEGRSCDSTARIRVRPGTAVSGTVQGYSSIRLRHVDGPVSLRVAGSPAIDIDRARALDLVDDGYASVHLKRLDGPASLTLDGSPTVRIDSVASPLMRVSQSGYGTVAIGRGAIDRIEARVSGSGRFSFLGTSGSADLSANGYSTVTVDRVTGTLDRQADAHGTINVLHSATTPASGPTETQAAEIQAADTHTPGAPKGITLDLSIPDWLVVLISAACLLWFFRARTRPFIHALLLRLTGRPPTHPPGGPTHRSTGPLRRASSTANRADRPHGWADGVDLPALSTRLARLENRVGRVESCVTSRNFHLLRQFRDLDRRHG